MAKNKGVHLTHCSETCKYGEDDCPVVITNINNMENELEQLKEYYDIMLRIGTNKKQIDALVYCLNMLNEKILKLEDAINYYKGNV